ncbi:MAG: MurR/RpiR family transcriptional regulator [Deltaproteobacteria bacterium]|nr:MurR/RpiR family transcriptional regulator [Deltaproteobacteria bacterium]
MSNVIEDLKKIYDTLTPTLGRLASYIIDNHKTAAFLNSMTLAKSSRVSEATVTRLAHALQMKGFSELKQALQEYAKNIISLPRYNFVQNNKHILNKVATMEKSIIDELVATISEEDFSEAADILHKARTIFVVGTHYNYVPAAYAAYFLRSVRPGVDLLGSVDVGTFSASLDAGPRDAALAVSTARYPNDTLKILRTMAEKGVRIISLTDSQVSPLIAISDLSFIVPMKYISHIDPYAGVMVFLHSLVNELHGRDPARSREVLASYEDFIGENNINADKSKSLVDI